MAVTRTIDVSLAIALALAMVALVAFKGDALYLGLWYYIAVPVVVLGACAAIRPAPLFLSGAELAIAISMLARLLTGALTAQRGFWAWAISSRCLAHLSLLLQPPLSQKKCRLFAHSPLSFLGLAGVVAGIS